MTGWRPPGRRATGMGAASGRATARAATLDRRPLRALGEVLDGLHLQAACGAEVLAQALQRETNEVALRQLRLARGRLQPRDLVRTDEVRALLEAAGALGCHEEFLLVAYGVRASVRRRRSK